MKKFLTFIFIIISFHFLSAQQQGFSYQAIIIDKNPQEIPGKDVVGNILPNHLLVIRFTILDSLGTIEYQEDQNTSTDQYGMINLMVGWGVPTSASPGLFSDIDWNGKPKSFKVSISLSQSDIFFTDFSYQPLTFVPYAFHRNITATGSMTIEGVSTLNNRLTVAKGSPTYLSGSLMVNKKTNLKDELTVDANSRLNGKVVIKSSIFDNKNDANSYPLVVNGNSQGIAIKIDTTRSGDTYFVSFWDKDNLQGRIEGQTTGELNNDPGYIFDILVNSNGIFQATVDVVKAVAAIVAASTSSTVCVGLGACVTSPIPSLIALAIADAVIQAANLAMNIAQLAVYITDRNDNIGITFQSGSNDYAEWLPKENLNDVFTAGDIVGIKGGFISRNTENASLIMVVTRQAIVLGNMPKVGKENEFEKVSFIGQVPVKVFGKVEVGDYIIPSGKNNGVGIAVSPQKITPEQAKQIVGIAWSGNSVNTFGVVNVAVGLHSNEIANLVSQQQTKIDELQNQVTELKNQVNQINNALAIISPEYAKQLNIQVPQSNNNVQIQQNNQNTAQNDDNILKIYYHEVTKDEVLEGINMAENILLDKGLDIKSNPFFSQIKSDPKFKEQFVDNLMKEIKLQFNKTYADDLKKGAIIINY